MEVTYIPFDMSGKIPLVEVEFEGEHLMFFFDSGAQASILNAKYFKNKEDDAQSNLKEEKLNKLDTIPIKMTKHLPLIECSIGKLKYNLVLDTGCESLLISVDHMQDLSKFTKNEENTKLRGAASDSANTVVSSKLLELKIGKMDYKDMDLVFSDISHISQSLEQNIDGIIGYPFFSSRKMILSYKQNCVILFE